MRFRGPAAEGARHAATVEGPDIQDLCEKALWESGGDTCYELGLIGPALVVYFGCCGGTLPELDKVKRKHFMPNNAERIDLPGAKWVLPREVPLFAFSKLKLLSYASQTSYVDDDDALFKFDDGSPLDRKSCGALFARLGERTGLPTWRLTSVLGKAFSRFMENCPSERCRLYLLGKKGVHMGGTVADARPTFTELRDNIKEAHPLAKVGREELSRPGPVRRAYPNPHFPAISRAGLADMRTRPRGNIVGAEIKNAIRTAVRSGKSVDETAAHYRVGAMTVRSAVKAETDFAPDPKPSDRSYQAAILGAAPPGRPVTVAELTVKVGEMLGAEVSSQSVWKQARRLGVSIKREHGFLEKHEAKLRQALEMARPRTLDKVRERLAASGVEAEKHQIKQALKSMGIQLGFERAELDRAAFEETLPQIRRQLAEKPKTSDAKIGRMILEHTGRKLGTDALSRLLASRSDLPPRAKPARKPRKEMVDNAEALAAAWPALRAAMTDDPFLTDVRAVEIVAGITGRRMATSVFRDWIDRRGDVPPRARRRRCY